MSSVVVRPGSAPTVVVITGLFDAVAEARLEDVMRLVRRAPTDVVFDVAGVDRLEVDGLLTLADHAQWLRNRSCSVVLRGAPSDAQQLARLLGYERTFGLV
jgi:anti-anti-sigma regulatory factor